MYVSSGTGSAGSEVQLQDEPPEQGILVINTQINKQGPALLPWVLMTNAVKRGK